MLLAVDVGNTNVVFALFDEGDIRARGTTSRFSDRSTSA